MEFIHYNYFNMILVSCSINYFYANQERLIYTLAKVTERKVVYRFYGRLNGFLAYFMVLTMFITSFVTTKCVKPYLQAQGCLKLEGVHNFLSSIQVFKHLSFPMHICSRSVSDIILTCQYDKRTFIYTGGGGVTGAEGHFQGLQEDIYRHQQ